MAISISTDRGAISAKPRSNGERAEFAIKGEHGLRLRVSADRQGNVSKMWSLLYTRKTDGKKCRVTLGEYPAMGIAEARQIAGRTRNQVRDGTDPAAERRSDKRAPTFEGLADEWLTRHAKAKKRSWREDERMLRHDLFPAFGDMKADKVTKADVLRLVDKIHDRGSPYQANRVLVLARTIYNWGMKRDMASRNPAALIDKPGQEVERTRVLDANEIHRFWVGLDSAPMTPALRIALKLSLLLGQRLNELALARKSEFDLRARLWTVPGQRIMPDGRQESGAKNKRDHGLPLTNEAIRLIEEAFELAGPGEWVFPGKATGKRIEEAAEPAGSDEEPSTLDTAARAPIGEGAISRAWGRSRAAMGLADVHAHDLRRTFATVAGGCGVRDFEIGLVLNHRGVRASVTGKVYNQADYLPEKQEVLEKVARRLKEIIGDTGAGGIDGSMRCIVPSRAGSIAAGAA